MELSQGAAGKVRGDVHNQENEYMNHRHKTANRREEQ